MPFKSKAQQKACYAKKARGEAKGWNCAEWSRVTNQKSLPERVKKKKVGKTKGKLVNPYRPPT
jgi:hypothetical protein